MINHIEFFFLIWKIMQKIIFKRLNGYSFLFTAMKNDDM